MTVTGAHLDGISAVTFGGAATTGLHVRSATELTVKTPPGAAGAVAVELVDDSGTASPRPTASPTRPRPEADPTGRGPARSRASAESGTAFALPGSRFLCACGPSHRARS
ncbi:IPT/TIG domain-containing protein [Streptomyces syringium]|uniref:IPT/TIG domain-containing protein n=1 Tax=Streptomyces syringium TaxID=76729 RepID=UPI003451B3C9